MLFNIETPKRDLVTFMQFSINCFLNFNRFLFLFYFLQKSKEKEKKIE